MLVKNFLQESVSEQQLTNYSEEEIYHLIGHNNKLDKIPIYIFPSPGCPSSFENLLTLDLSNNFIEELPREISLLSFLRELNLSYNCLKTFNISNMKYLLKLVLDDNLIEQVTSLNNLPRLEFIDLSNNFLTTFPKCIEYLPSIQSINLNHNKIFNVPVNLKDRIQCDIYSTEKIHVKKAIMDSDKKHLYHGHREIFKIYRKPDTKFTLTEFTTESNDLVRPYKIFGDGLELKSIPKQIIMCPNILNLSLTSCGLESMTGIGNLSCLRYLKLSNNAINNIPWEILHLQFLQYLDLSHNIIFTVDLLAELVTLKTLYLSHNCISVIPKKFANLQNLVFLDMNENCIEEIPLEISLLPNLHQFSCRQLTQTPKEDQPSGHSLPREIGIKDIAPSRPISVTTKKKQVRPILPSNPISIRSVKRKR